MSWHEDLLEKEVPPSWMWPFEDELKEWFEQVKADRENRYGGDDADDDGDSGGKPMMLSNEFARGRRK